MRMKKQQWQDVIDLNLTGVFLCTQVFIMPQRNSLHPRLTWAWCVANISL
jgi:NAD(P)-dependent dehydrogenase (short-subunit alcohol dehydrogenase family)